MLKQLRSEAIIVIVLCIVVLLWFFLWGPGSRSKVAAGGESAGHRDNWLGTLGAETPKDPPQPLPRRSASVVIAGSPVASATVAPLVAAGSAPLAERSPSSAATATPGLAIEAPGAAGMATIRITTLLDGPIPTPKKLNLEADPFCAKAGIGPVYDESLRVDPKTSALANVFVRILHAPVGGGPTPSEIDETGCMYRPRVVGLIAGSDLVIRSNDETTHNVHAYGGEESLFNRAQGGKGQFTRNSDALRVKDGPVTFKCDIHPWMTGYAFVTDSPYFAVTDATGTASITAPPGHYTLQAWHERFGFSTADATLTAGVTSDVQFRIGKRAQ